MRRIDDLEAFIRDVEARKAALGITGEMIAACRNSGERRTDAKRDLLARLKARAEAAGKTPLPANF